MLISHSDEEEKLKTFIKAGKFGFNANKILYITYDDPQWTGRCTVFLVQDRGGTVEIVLSAEESNGLREFMEQILI